MGSCYYYMKAIWARPLSAAQAKKIRAFFVQSAKAEDAGWSGGVPDWKEYPALNTPGIQKVWESLRISGPEETNDRLDVETGDTVVRYSNEVSHMCSWQPLCDLMVSEFGAAQTSWLSEESDGVDPGSVLDFQDDAAIVQAILERPVRDLPTFLGIHPILDAQIARLLSQTKKPRRR